MANTTLGDLSGTPSLADLTKYINRSYGGVGAEEIDTPEAKQMLAALQKYDPNAQFQGSQMGGEGASGATSYSLMFDPSKLPDANGKGQLGGTNENPDGSYSGGSAPIARFSTVQPNMQLVNPNATYNSPVYGKVTDNRNIATPASMLDTLGPLAVSAFGMFAPMAFGAAGLGMGGGAAQAAIGGANGGLAATEGGVAGLSGTPSAFVSQLARGIPNYGRSISDGNFNPLSLIPLAGAGFGLPSWLSSGASTIGNLARGGRATVNPISAGAAALQLLGSGNGG